MKNFAATATVWFFGFFGLLGIVYASEASAGEAVASYATTGNVVMPNPDTFNNHNATKSGGQPRTGGSYHQRRNNAGR